MKFALIAAILTLSSSAFALRPLKACGLKSNNSIVIVSSKGTIMQYILVPAELRDIDLYGEVKNGAYICVEGELNDKDVLVAKTVRE